MSLHSQNLRFVGESGGAYLRNKMQNTSLCAGNRQLKILLNCFYLYNNPVLFF